jgi:hypothetical protein
MWRTVARAFQALVAWAALSCSAMAPVRAEAPFTPRPDVPDHIVIMVEHAGHPQEERTRTVMHRGMWSRVETAGARPTIGYFTDGEAIAVRVDRAPPGPVGTASFVRNGLAGLWDTTPRNTGQRQTVLGETCSVWETLRARDVPLAKLSCVTDDGIELSYKWVSKYVQSSGEAVRVERRPLADADVQPPRDLFTWSWWTAGQPTSEPATAGFDYETVMRQPNGDGVRVTRRHGPWSHVDESETRMRRSVVVTSPGLRLQYWELRDGARQEMTILRLPPSAPQQAPSAKALNQSEKVLGETCDWFDTMPGMADAGQAQCRTADGIVLKESNFGRGYRSELVATRLSRRPVTLDEAMPPAELLAPKFWGLD